jgi:hypothetical protein
MHSTALQNIFNSKSPAAQRNWMKALRGWVDHCLSLKMIKRDPLAEVKLTKMKTRGHHPCESAECEQFEKRHAVGTRARLAYELLLQAGQSRCDVVRMGRQHIRKGVMTMGRQKTGVPFNVEVMPRLQAAMDAMPASNHLTFLVTAKGHPFTAAGFGNWFRDMCREGEAAEAMYLARAAQSCGYVPSGAGRNRSSPDGLVRLELDLAGAGVYQGREPETHGAERGAAHFRNRHWLTF